MVSDYNYITCPKCGHDRNASTLKKCEICGQKLGKGKATRPVSAVPFLLIGLFVALATLGIGYVFFKDRFQTASTGNEAPGVQGVADNPPASSADSSSAGTGEASAGKFELVSAANPDLYQTLSQIPNVPAGTFNYGGSTTFAPLRSDRVVQAIAQAHPPYQLRYTEPITGNPGSGSGIEMLLQGQLSFSQSSRPVKDTEFSQAQQRGFRLEQVPVAIDGIAFYVNPSLKIPGLTLAQVQNIFTGKIKNWQEVGGSNLPITVYSRNLKAGGTVDFLVEDVLGGEAFTPAMKEVRDTTDSLRKVAQTPGGIGYATASEVIGQQTIRPLPLAKGSDQDFISPFTGEETTGINQAAFADGSYAVTRRLFVVIKRDGRLDEQAGVAYANMLLSNEGQELVQQAGFVPVR